MTGESIFGELRGGTVLRVSCNLAFRLFNPACAVLASFGAAVPFEVAVGLNGIVWVRASSRECSNGQGLNFIVVRVLLTSLALRPVQLCTPLPCAALLRAVRLSRMTSARRSYGK